METPLEFLNVFREELRSTGIPFAITSGMACIRYGLQQTTKDSDWIVAAAELPRLRGLAAQTFARGDAAAMVHLRDAATLRRAWSMTPATTSCR